MGSDICIEITSDWGNSKWFREEHSTEVASEGRVEYYRLNDQNCGRRRSRGYGGARIRRSKLWAWSRDSAWFSGTTYWVIMRREWETRKAGSELTEGVGGLDGL